eukprot:SAG31_NODE_30_length_32545_cov_9.378999_13_plen_76_part_00
MWDVRAQLYIVDLLCPMCPTLRHGKRSIVSCDQQDQPTECALVAGRPQSGAAARDGMGDSLVTIGIARRVHTGAR